MRRDGILALFPNADFANNGWTVIVTLTRQISGTWFTIWGRNLASWTDGTTFSFSSTLANRNLTSKNYLRLDIGFFANSMELLPNDQRIEKVQLIENEYANTECIADDRYESFAIVGASCGEMVDGNDQGCGVIFFLSFHLSQISAAVFQDFRTHNQKNP